MPFIIFMGCNGNLFVNMKKRNFEEKQKQYDIMKWLEGAFRTMYQYEWVRSRETTSSFYVHESLLCTLRLVAMLSFLAMSYAPQPTIGEVTFIVISLTHIYFSL